VTPEETSYRPAGLETLYSDARATTRATYRLDVAPAALGELRDLVFGVRLALDSHRALVRDVLRGADLGPGHPYSAYLATLQRAYPSAAPLNDLLRAKAETVRDIARAGVRDPIELFFGNRGLLYCHGYHRLAAALELGLPTVPVAAHLVDAELTELAERLFAIYTGDLRFTLYQPVDHPFLGLYPVQPANAAWGEKVAAVAGVATGWTGRVVEVGAHFGGLTRELRSAGVACEAIDVDPSYLALQPLLEAVGLTPIPYARRALEDLASEPGPLRLVAMGLWHHLLGKADLWATTQRVVLPWMRQAVPEAVVELSLLPTYLGGPAAVALTSDDEVRAFWESHDYTATQLCEGAMRRVTYHVRWNRSR